jgi:hypothetical protein
MCRHVHKENTVVRDEEAELSGELVRYAPIPAGSDGVMVRYLTRHRDRTVALLGEIDETLELLRRTLDANQPKETGKIGIIWIRQSGRMNGSTVPAVVRWSCHRASGTFDLFWRYKILSTKNLPRLAKSRSRFVSGHEATVEALRQVQKLMNQRAMLLAHWGNLSRSLSVLELSVPELQTSRHTLLAQLSAAPHYEQSLKYTGDSDVRKNVT